MALRSQIIAPASLPVGGGIQLSAAGEEAAQIASSRPVYVDSAKLWIYGNARLLGGPLFWVPASAGCADRLPCVFEQIEMAVERLVLESKVLVCGVHNPLHQRAAIVPLRWGSPRIVVFSGGFYHHLGKDLKEEPFRAARLWRYAWDPTVDLAISRRAPDKLPTFAHLNPTVDRLVRLLAEKSWPGLGELSTGLVSRIAKVSSL